MEASVSELESGQVVTWETQNEAPNKDGLVLLTGHCATGWQDNEFPAISSHHGD